MEDIITQFKEADVKNDRTSEERTVNGRNAKHGHGDLQRNSENK